MSLRFQVAEGVLDHINNFPDSSYTPLQSSLRELVALHGLEQRPCSAQLGRGTPAISHL